MKYILLPLAAGLVIIGVHQTMLFGQESVREGIAASYWAFMFAAGLLFYYQHLKKKEKEQKGTSEVQATPKAKPATQPTVKNSTKKRKKPRKLKS